MPNRIVALYIRLSLEDSKTHSLSIENQRKLLNSHIAELPEYECSEVVEFVDNGYSGTNFERPAITKLLDMVAQNEVKLILVKDFSRISRNMLDTGHFIEKVFPLYNVRFISINDFYDSNDFVEDTGGLDVTFKYLINEFYSKDLSIKAKSSKYLKMQKGEYVLENTPYGYNLDENRKMVIDYDVSENVKLIFDLFCDNKKIPEIKKILFDRDILTPARYKASKGKNYYNLSNSENIWNEDTIRRIIYDERYIGTYVIRKNEVTSVGSRKLKKRDEKDWIKIPNSFPAIIDEYTFHKANSLIKRFKSSVGKDVNFLLKGKIFCGICKHSLYRKNIKNAYYYCNYTKNIEDFECNNSQYLEVEMETMIYNILKKQAEIILNAENIDSQKSDVTIDSNEALLKIQQLKNDKKILYERFVDNEISIDIYKDLKRSLDRNLIELENLSSTLEVENKVLLKNKATAKMNVDFANLITKENLLTQKLIDLLIDKIFIYPDKRIEINFLVEDFFHEYYSLS